MSPNRIRVAGVALFAAALLTALAVDAQSRRDRPNDAGEPLVQVALLLDTSNSMDGLIAQAKTQLWKVVNEFARAKRSGKTPRLEVALYQYGNDSLSASSGYIQQVVPLTTDLDRISEKLFALRTNGGSEYCGQVIDVAAKELAWSDSKAALKMIFIAGNEPFTQGTVDFHGAVKHAVTKGITVNTVFCGSEQEGIGGHWRDGAVLADGRYSFIDSNRVVAAVTAPQDAELARLATELNGTYVGYGDKGAEGKTRQAAQDVNASSAGMGAGVQRAMAKSSAHYRNDDWDLVDAVKSGKKAEAMPAAALPAEMQAMSPTERGEFVAEKAKKRDSIQSKMRELEKDRRAFVAEEEKKGAAAGASTLDSALLGAVHEQATKAAYTFE